MGRVLPAVALLFLCAVLLSPPEWKVAKCFQLPRSALPPILVAPVARQSQVARSFFGPFGEQEGEPQKQDGRQPVYGGPEDLFNKARPLPQQAEMFGEQIWYDVELGMNLGLGITPMGEGPGEGVAVRIAPEGAAMDLMREVVADPKFKKMWIQEGDELLAIEGESTEGSEERTVEIIRKVKSDPNKQTVKLTLARKKTAPIMVVFPNGTYGLCPRLTKLKRVAESSGFESGCTCENGMCGKCWFRDSKTGEVYVLPLNVPGVVPSLWRKAGELGLQPGQGEYETWIPLRLERAPEAYEREFATEGVRREKINKRLQERGYDPI